jgi:thiopeptide-type bacteriocin biosynthesis protein
MTRWTSWHLHLASPARAVADRVVTDVLGPAVPADRPWFFVRFWQGGPHVRLRVGDLTGAARAALEQELVARLAGVGRLRPGEPPVDAAAYRAGAARLAAAERGADRAVSALREPGVHRAEYAPETDRYGGPGPLRTSEELFGTSSRVVLAGLRSPRATARRHAVAVHGTRVAAAALGEDPAVFHAIGLAAWREQAAAHGHPAEHVAVATRVDAPPPPLVGPGPFAAWGAGLARLADEVRAGSPAHPGAVLASHVHMLHNRLGLGLLEELRTYAQLAAAHPLPVTARPDAALVGTAS